MFKKNVVCLAVALAVSGAWADGDSDSACGAIICLSTGTRPSECNPPIQRYFSINHKKLSDTLQGRANFLSLCPVGGDPKMASLVSAIVYGAGSCEVASINANNTVSYTVFSNKFNRYIQQYYISNVLPDSCAALVNHSYTDLKSTVPVYVGDPMRGGFWVAKEGYQQAFQGYAARVAAEDAAAAAFSYYGN